MTELKKINEAWLNIDIDDKNIFNPSSILKTQDDDYHLRLVYLMTKPEYFSFLCKHILNIQILPSQALMLCEMWNRKFPMLIASRGFGKSLMLSLTLCLELCFCQKEKLLSLVLLLGSLKFCLSIWKQYGETRLY